MFTIFIPVYGFLFLPILSALLGDPAHFLDRSTKIQWALMISVFCISHIPALLTLDISGYEGKNLLLMIFLILVVQSSDVLQYVWGKLFGKHKIAPTLSPSKTLEGFVGGVLSASLLGMLLHWLTPFNAWQAFFNESVNLPNGILRRARDVSNETQYGRERLGEYDQWPWWYFRPYGFTVFLRTNFLPCGALFLGIVINHENKKRAVN